MAERNEVLRDQSEGLVGRRVSRRGFVVSTATVAAGAALLPMSMGTAEAATKPLAMTLGPRGFRALRGRRFNVKTGEVTATLELIGVYDHPRDAARGGQCFSLRFRHVAGARLHQGTYHFSGAEERAFPLFIVPGAGRSRTYTAVINRLS